MPQIDLRLHWLAIALDDGQTWLHAAGFPGLNRIAATRKGAERQLVKRIEGLLEREGPDHGHRRVWPTEATLSQVAIEFRPPARSVEWRQPVQLTVELLSAARGGQWVGFAPALPLSVLAESEAALREAVVQQAQVRLLKFERARLRELATLERFGGATLSDGSLTLALPSARTRAARQAPVTEKVLDAVAEPFAPRRAFALEDAVLRLKEALSGESAHSVLLVGPPGCGKTTAVAELARRHPSLGLLRTSGARLIAGQSGYGQWQQRLRDLIRELAPGKTVLHLGALTELMEVGRCRAGEQSMAGFLRGDIARGNLRVIAECTPEELAAIEVDEPGLIAAFQTVQMRAPDPTQTREILRAEAQALGIWLGEAEVVWLERLHRRYAGYSARPARVLKFLRELPPGEPIDAAQLTRRFAAQTGLPVWLLDEAERYDADAAEAFFQQRVLGQQPAIHTLLQRIAEIKADLHREGRPLGSFLLIGPTGTGKTELAKTLAAFLFGSEQRLTRFDLSQCTDPLSVQRLIGSSAYGAPEGLLTARIREQPFSVLLLDEFEKADPRFFDLLLQMLGDGRLTDGRGRVADFSNAVVLLTSNLGATEAGRASVGFAERSGTDPYQAAVQRFVRPELYNRFDAILPFAPLGPAECRAITAREVGRVLARDGLRQRGVEVELPDRLVDELAASGFDAAFGARALKRQIEAQLVVPMAEVLAAAPTAYRLLWPQGAPVAAVAPRSAGTVAAQAEAARQFRRQCTALESAPALSRLVDEAELLALNARRLAKRKREPPEADVRRLRLLNALKTDVAALSAAAATHEDTVLEALWSGVATELPSTAPWLLQQQALKRRIFAAGQRAPDRIELLLVAEVQSWLLELLAACKAVATLQPVQLIERHGSQIAIRAMTDTPELRRLWAAPPASVIGCTVIATGELCAPLFAAECGIHVWRPPR
nr:AAA family ATPase [Xanthomonadales bacterium]